jgi:hypothetical protein
MVDTQDLKARAEALFKKSGEAGTAAADEYKADVAQSPRGQSA